MTEAAANVPVRTCAWCETPHPEHISIEWTHGDRLYFCTYNCHREWGEAGRACPVPSPVPPPPVLAYLKRTLET